jgi:two-component system, sensor histidine kinase and response regulator
MLSGTFPQTIADRLQQIWLQMATEIAGDAIVVSEAQGAPPASPLLIGGQTDRWERFLLLVSTDFSALVVLKAVEGGQKLGLTLDLPEIQFFMALLPPEAMAIGADPQANASDWQQRQLRNLSAWQNRLMILLLQQLPVAATELVCQPVQVALTQQLSEDQILYEVVAQIRETLELPTILKNAIDKVQEYLQLDRLIIYQFEERYSSAPEILQRIGRVVYEAKLDESIVSVLNFQEPLGCFDDFQHWHHYSAGQHQTISDVRSYYARHECFSQQMDNFQVRAKLVVPILVRGKLWGLLIAHDCHGCYEWQPWQSQLLQRVAGHMEIAIYQSEIYTQLQNQKASLELQVDRQTRDLRDALTVAQSANEAKTEFLAVLSHELRTPLTSILGLSYTLLNLLNSNLDDRQKSYLQTIKHSGDHLLELINDMLEVSQLEAGKAVLRISEFSLMKMLNQVSQMVQQKADEKQVKLRLEIMDGDEDISSDPEQDIRFRGDIKRIKQITLNLLTNAIKFTEAQGEIVLRSWREFDYLVLQVDDTGIGIAQEQIPQIFQKFRQLEPTMNREHAGIGLGLALTKQLVELHGGWIEVESDPGQGSTFTVWLAAQALRLPKVAVEEPKRNGIKTIVLLESEISQSDSTKPKRAASGFIADILTAAGYQVVSLTETYLAHKQIELWQPDLVIIDQQIGEKLTNKILRYLHNLTKSQHIRYLLIASKDQVELDDQVVPVESLLWDPLQPEQLLVKIAKLI